MLSSTGPDQSTRSDNPLWKSPFHRPAICTQQLVFYGRVAAPSTYDQTGRDTSFFLFASVRQPEDQGLLGAWEYVCQRMRHRKCRGSSIHYRISFRILDHWSCISRYLRRCCIPLDEYQQASEWEFLFIDLDETAPLVYALLLVLRLCRRVLVLVGRVMICRSAALRGILTILLRRKEFHIIGFDLQVARAFPSFPM